MKILETAPFERVRGRYFDEDSFGELTWSLFLDPQQGSVIPHTGGVRKLRWSRPGSGKRGGLQVIYYVVHSLDYLYLMTVYAKNERADIPRDVLRKLREILDDEQA